MPDETIESVAKDIKASWIADGTPAVEPVTTETPAVVAVPEQPRGPDGKFLAADASSATPLPAAAAAPATPTPASTPAAIQEFIEAQLADGSPFKVPKGLRLPLKRGDTIVYDPVEEIQSRGMMERDYRIKTDEASRFRRETEQMQTQLRAETAKVEARDKWLAEREAEMIEAQKDPAKWESYQQMQALYQTNPHFRKTLDDALAKRETDAEIAVYREQEHAAAVTQGAELAYSWITEASREFPGVDPERVRVLYSQALKAGMAAIDPADVRAIYQQEAGYLTKSRGPLEQELATLKAQVEALTAAKAAEKQNATTQHAVQRAKTPPVATVGNAPTPVPPLTPGRFGQNELVERNAEWARQR